jgi:hypothetical protein
LYHLLICRTQLYLRSTPKDSIIWSQMYQYLESPHCSPTNDVCHWTPIANASTSFSNMRKYWMEVLISLLVATSTSRFYGPKSSDFGHPPN